MDMPTLTEWLSSTRVGHPLRGLTDSLDPWEQAVAHAFEEILASVVEASPTRWEGKRREFRRLSTAEELWSLRAELLVASRLARAGVSFQFGDRSVVNPDLILIEERLGIEITAKLPRGLQALYDELEDVLLDLPGWSLHLHVTHVPTAISAAIRRELANRVQSVIKARTGTGEGGVEHIELEPVPEGESPRAITVQVLPVPALAFGHRITWDMTSDDLAPSLEPVKDSVLGVLRDPQKIAQAQSMPTILVVDISRLGIGWLRPPQVWATVLTAELPEECPFIGVATMTTSLDDSGTDIGLAFSPTSSISERITMASIASKLGIAVGQSEDATPRTME
jgi:hypothetical protein